MTQPFGQKYINEFDTPSCGTNGTQLCIGPDGILSSCQQTNESFLDNKFILGNVRDGITNLDVLDLFRSRRANILIPKQCINCPIVRCCSDCPMLCYTSTGDIHKRIGGCGEAVAHARAQLYLLKKMEENPDYPYYQRTKQHIKDTNKYDPNFHYLYLDNYEYD
jgi:radical SAM protein with 4Fe4S-binding SPASM domain